MNRIVPVCCALVALAFMNTASSHAAPILFNTGVEASGNLLADGVPDAHFVVNNFGTSVASTSLSATPPADTSSEWITSPANFGAGVYTFYQTFTLPAAGTMTVTGQWAAFGDGVAISLDNTSLGSANTPTPGNADWTPFSISGPVQAGANTLAFSVARDLQAGSLPGLRVELFSVLTPEPASLVLAGTLLPLVLIRRRSVSAR